MPDSVTEWFDKRYKPRYNGLYQIQTRHWPWPYLILWDNEQGWADTNFTHWRGLNKEN